MWPEIGLGHRALASVMREDDPLRELHAVKAADALASSGMTLEPDPSKGREGYHA